MRFVLIKRIFYLGLLSIWRHRLRSFLTILGIVFGVCSVIAMLAIGEGASYEAQEQIKRLGSQNIILKSVKPPQSDKINTERTFVLEYGLTYKDADRIVSTIPTVESIVPSRSVREDISYGRRRVDAEVIGTVPWHLQIANVQVARGRFITQNELDDRKNVAVISSELASRLFTIDDPLGKSIRVGADYYTVIGVLEPMGPIATATGEKTSGLRLYIPLSAAKERFGDIVRMRTSGSINVEKVELHEIIVKVRGVETVMPTAAVLTSLLKRYHKDQDYEVVVPLELLRQAQRTKAIFNIVLGSIAAISLLVGGIGIMNIMLASVTERTKEIGIRRALGAKRRDIITQFLTETVLLSGTGGTIGVIIGVAIPFLITAFAGMVTIIRWWSLFGAFSISIVIGVVFGIYPAWRAAMMNPITALRHE
ncbi:MAG: ABC transporter permease [Candidatus Sumerlaeia bacterium]